MNHLTPDLLNAYLDDQLDAPTRATIAMHLAECAHCQRELAALRAVFSALSTLHAEPIPTDLAPQVLAQIRSQPPILAAQALLAVQLALAIVLVQWLAPTLADWIATTWTSVPIPLSFDFSFDGFSELNAQIAMLQNLWDAFTHQSSPLDMTPLQWLLIVALSTIVWVVGNRLLLTLPNGARDTQQEAVS